MNAGVILKDSTEKESQVVFLGEETSCHSVKTNDSILELLERKEPEVVAFDTGTEKAREEFTEKEQELRDEGHSFQPISHDRKRSKRLEALKSRLFDRMTEKPHVIRFDPQITADELAIHDDSGLRSIGVDPSSIESAEQFDAMLGAITARFYEQNQVKDLGIIVPEPVE